MDRDEVSPADELVELDVVDVSALALLRRVQDDEHVIGVDVDPGHVVALDAGLHRPRVESEHLREHVGGLLVAYGHVHPHEPPSAVEKGR